MKHFKLLALIFSAGLVLAACQRLGSKLDQSVRSVRTFIPGTFVNYAKGPYSIAHDTLLIRLWVLGRMRSGFTVVPLLARKKTGS